MHTQPRMKTNANPAWGLLLGDSVPNLTKAWKQIANEVEALDYMFLEEEFQFTKAKL